MGKPGIAAALAVLASALVATPAAAGVPLRFSTPVTVGRSVGDDVLRAVDLSGDGIPDLVSADGDWNEVSIWLGRGDGSFRGRRKYRVADVVDVAVTDISGDGRPDLIVAGFAQNGPITVLLNAGGGRFRRDRVVRSGPLAWAVAAADVNRDGLIDLVVGGNARRRNVAVLLREPTGSFAAARRFTAVLGVLGATQLVTGDLNGDGNVDLAVAGIEDRAGTDSVAILLGNGDGTFKASSPAEYREPADLQLADVNRDGKLDLVVADTEKGNNVAVSVGKGDGTFAPRLDSRSGWAWPFAVADIDGDAIPDVTIGGFVLRGHGDGTFGGAQPLPTHFYADQSAASAVADFNLDGRQDIAIGGGKAFGDYWAVGVFLNWTGLPAPPCVVPPLDRAPFDGSRPRLRRAKRLLRSTGCAVGRVRWRPSRRVRKGRILEQHPKSGSVLPSHSRVDLVVSRGPRR